MLKRPIILIQAPDVVGRSHKRGARGLSSEARGPKFSGKTQIEQGNRWQEEGEVGNRGRESCKHG
jgi:hypothetical protein